jgi:predicted alpha/beta hydrolase family esterase
MCAVYRRSRPTSSTARPGQAIQHELEQIDGPVILVAHSAGVLMVAHWAARHSGSIKGALLAAPPDLNATWPANYPSRNPQSQRLGPSACRCAAVRSLVAGSTNDHLASLEAVTRMARDWGSERWSTSARSAISILLRASATGRSRSPDSGTGSLVRHLTGRDPSGNCSNA